MKFLLKACRYAETCFKIIQLNQLKKGGTAMSVYKVVEIIGTSPKSWEDAVQKAILTAGKSLEKLRVAQVMEQDVTVDKGKVMEYRIKLNVSFKLKDI